MADTASTILREYLVRVGFSVDKTEKKKFEDGLEKWDKRADKLAKALFSAASASAAMVAAFSYNMEKLYYASRRIDSTVGNIQALDFASRNVGVKNIQQSMEALARNLRSNPGLTGLLQSLGVPVKGRDKADVLMDLVTQLKKMPFFVAEKFGNLFGIDADTLFMLQDGLDKWKEANAQRKQWAAEMGVDSDAAARASVELNNQWREVAERAGLFRDALVISILPTLKEVGDVTKLLLADWTAIVQQGDVFARLLEGLGLKQTGGGVTLSKESQQRLGLGEADQDTIVGQNLGTGEQVVFRKKLLDRLYDRFMKWGGAKKYQTPLADQASVDAAQDTTAFTRGGTGIATAPATIVAPKGSGQLADGGPAPGPKVGKAEAARQIEAANKAAPLFAALEKRYGLPPGLLGRVWAQESSRGGNMLSSAGAQGHFQFMPSTAKQYGLQDPFNLEQSAEASAQMYSNLLKKYGGDINKAAAAYNWGEGRVDRYGLGKAPAETRGYMAAIAGSGGQQSPTIMQNVNINITGASDPKETGAQVQAGITQANSDITRNFKPRVQ
ncbi:portal protein [Edwardsiella phage vB_EpM_ZHS]|jgi:hypothetical protein|nr:portal protein [Edwardsiella phage vB_EpM_ZHS]